jgi:DNA polymerase-1
MSKKLYLLDALALIYRAYYALIRTPRITSTGINTNAQFGFTNTLLEIIKKENPSHIAVCFDTHAPTERHTDFTDYKANREEAPEDLLSSLPHIKAIIEGFNIPVVECDGYEADDVIGTLAWQACQARVPITSSASYPSHSTTGILKPSIIALICGRELNKSSGASSLLAL